MHGTVCAALTHDNKNEFHRQIIEIQSMRGGRAYTNTNAMHCECIELYT